VSTQTIVYNYDLEIHVSDISPSVTSFDRPLLIFVFVKRNMTMLCTRMCESQSIIRSFISIQQQSFEINIAVEDQHRGCRQPNYQTCENGMCLPDGLTCDGVQYCTDGSTDRILCGEFGSKS